MKTVRNGQKVWPYCEECGCRVFYHRLWGAEYLAHKLKDKETDKQGHRCSEIGNWWKVDDNIRSLLGV